MHSLQSALIHKSKAIALMLYCTLPSTVAQFTEAASLAQPVESLLLDEL